MTFDNILNEEIARELIADMELPEEPIAKVLAGVAKTGNPYDAPILAQIMKAMA